jgi:hypothetical protein
MLGLGSSDGRIVLVEVEEGDREGPMRRTGAPQTNLPGVGVRAVTKGPTWFFAALENGSIWYHSRVRAPGDCLTRGR